MRDAAVVARDCVTLPRSPVWYRGGSFQRRAGQNRRFGSPVSANFEGFGSGRSEKPQVANGAARSFGYQTARFAKGRVQNSRSRHDSIPNPAFLPRIAGREGTKSPVLAVGGERRGAEAGYLATNAGTEAPITALWLRRGRGVLGGSGRPASCRGCTRGCPRCSWKAPGCRRCRGASGQSTKVPPRARVASFAGRDDVSAPSTRRLALPIATHWQRKYIRCQNRCNVNFSLQIRCNAIRMRSASDLKGDW